MRYLFFVLFICSGILTFAQATLSTARTRVYKSYVSNNKAEWEAGINDLKRLCADTWNCPPQTLFELALSEYGLIAYCISTKNTGGVEAQIAEAEGHLNVLVKRNPQHAAAHSLLGSLIAMRIGLSPGKAIYLGPRSSNYLDQGIKLGANDPFAWAEMGNMRYHAPALFGGSYDEAIKAFKKSVELFDAQPTLRKDNWIYLHALTWLGRSYEAKGMKTEAIAAYKKLLAFEPGFTWVRNELLPAAEKSR
jgi:tetratricopeptide (TPR) repeat protein